ncbi:hypothetical protein [Flavobacterium psychrotrophum]|uniref:hypothetical protein n=1 Tax=Flavobacterium psychrotrophum TaxID=2294119 RepID=UPI0013C4E87F|nr:hypothetical protein [Flavobacterium psychrotrophum]
MKKLLVSTLMLLTCFCFGQNLEKDTIKLQEVAISNKKLKTKSIRYSTSCTHHEHFDYNSEIATLVNALPAGYLQSIQIDVNNIFYKTSITFKDVEMEFLFYEVNADGSPGKQLPARHKFTISGNQNGKMIVDVSGLSVYNPGQVYISLKRITPPVLTEYTRDSEIHFVCGDKKKYRAYRQRYNQPGWSEAKHCQALKMVVRQTVL